LYAVGRTRAASGARPIGIACSHAPVLTCTRPCCMLTCSRERCCSRERSDVRVRPVRARRRSGRSSPVTALVELTSRWASFPSPHAARRGAFGERPASLLPPPRHDASSSSGSPGLPGQTSHTRVRPRVPVGPGEPACQFILLAITSANTPLQPKKLTRTTPAMRRAVAVSPPSWFSASSLCATYQSVARHVGGNKDMQ